MIWMLAHWKLLSGALAGILLAGYIGALNIEVATLRLTVARLDADLANALGAADQCRADLDNLREARRSDATVPDDLDGFTVPDHWLRFLDTPGQ